MRNLTRAQKCLPLLSLILIWPALLNGTPFFFPDTSTYIREADAAVYHLTGHASQWSEVIQAAAPQPVPDAGAGHDEAAGRYQSSFYKNVLLGRSIYYGLFLYLGVFFDTLWVPVILQALAAGIVITGWTRHFVDPAADRRKFAATVLAINMVAAFTTLPYYVSILMPDVFSGLLILVSAVLAAGWKRESMGWRLVWLALLLFSALAHGSNVLILFALALIAFLLAPLFRRPQPRVAITVMLFAALAGLAGEAVFKEAIHHMIGREALRPPFLSARLIADGPGAAYLEESCPGSGFAYCGFRSRITPFSDNILWSERKEEGIFSATTPAMQARIAGEEMRFVRAVFFRYPLWTSRTVLENGLRQTVTGGLSEFNLPFERERLVAGRFPKESVDALLASRGQRGAMPVWFYQACHWPAILLSLLVLASAFFISVFRACRYPVAVMMLGVLANALICGAMSGAHERYQDRVVWLLILWAAMLVVTRAGGAGVGDRKPPHFE